MPFIQTNFRAQARCSSPFMGPSPHGMINASSQCLRKQVNTRTEHDENKTGTGSVLNVNAF